MSDENTGFAELTAISNFSFLQGGAHPQEMVQRAAHLGYQAVGLADRNTLAGVVRGHVAAREAGIRFVPGARLVTQCGFEAVCYPRDRTAYAALSQCL
ncbi:MAG: PHP domain-containing protein, partial [Pseudomonadota bacterium]|nr:PHP domain-containing protein [Pseudomonadota bacterium]